MGITDWVPSRSEFSPRWLNPIAFRRATVKYAYMLIFVLLVAVSIEMILLSLGINVVFPEEITLIELLSAIGPLILSGLLVYLYYQQKQILAEEHRADLSVNRFIGADEDRIRLKISNSGSGAARRIFLRIELDFDDGQVEGRTNFLDLQKESEDDPSRFVKPYESDAIFSKRLLLPIVFPGESDYRIPPFGMGMRFANQQGATSGHLKMELVWEDAIHVDRIPIFDEEFEVRDYEDFENFIVNYPERSAVLSGGLD